MDDKKAEPEWVKNLSDLEIVEHFKKFSERERFTYVAFGRNVFDMRKRLLKILIDGLASKK